MSFLGALAPQDPSLGCHALYHAQLYSLDSWDPRDLLSVETSSADNYTSPTVNCAVKHRLNKTKTFLLIAVAKMSTGKRLAKRSILGTRVAAPIGDGLFMTGIIQVREILFDI